MSAKAKRRSGALEKLFEGFTRGLHFKFLRDLAWNTLVFFAIFAAAAGLNLLVHLLKAMDIADIIVYGMRGLEYLMFLGDIAWFAIYLLASTKLLILEVLRSARPAAEGQPIETVQATPQLIIRYSQVVSR